MALGAMVGMAAANPRPMKNGDDCKPGVKKEHSHERGPAPSELDDKVKNGADSSKIVTEDKPATNPDKCK